MHEIFEERADRAAAEYEAMAEQLLERQEGGASMLTADYKTDARKKVQQTARSLLPNETEAPMVFTGNVRALRHIIEMRADAHAESEIRNLALRIFLCLRTVDPILFGDYELASFPTERIPYRPRTVRHRPARRKHRNPSNSPRRGRPWRLPLGRRDLVVLDPAEQRLSPRSAVALRQIIEVRDAGYGPSKNSSSRPIASGT